MLQKAQINLIASLVLSWGLATVALPLRLVARRMKGLSLCVEDYLSIAAYVSVPKVCSPTGQHMYIHMYIYGSNNDNHARLGSPLRL